MTDPCPPDEVIAAWVDGELGAAERAALEAHAADCAACRALTAAVAGIASSGADPRLGAEGATIGRYRVLGPVGHGAMGVVLRGRDPVLDRDVAIKMVNAAADDEAQRSRMIAEAQILARVDHPNVVDVYDAGLIGAEVFVAMELVIGTTLQRWLAAAPRDVASRLDVVLGIGRGIAAVHDAGLVHRDVKPDNILVRDRGGAVLVDFGLARRFDAAGATGSGVAGTPRFLAPEVRTGAAASPAADQYAWWTVVDEALAGAALSGRARRALARAIARGRADRPNERFPSMHHAVVALARATRRARRWPWLAALACGGLFAVLVAVWPARAADPCAVGPLDGWTPARRDAIAASVTAAGASGPRVVAAIDARARGTIALRTAACRAERSSRSSDRALALRQRACADQSWTNAERIFPGLLEHDREIERAAIDELITVIPIERCETGSVPAVEAPPPGDRAAAASDLLARMRDVMFARSQPPADRLARMQAFGPELRALDYAPLLTTWHAEVGSSLAMLGRLAEARTELAEAARLAEASGDDDQRARVLLNSLRVEYQDGNLDTKALEASASAAVERLGNPSITAEVLISTALVRMARGDLPGAVEAAHRASAIYDTIALDAHAQTVSVAQNLGGLEQMRGDLVAAQAAFDHALELARRRYGDAAYDTLVAQGARASNLLARDQVVEARDQLVVVAAGLLALRGPADPQVMNARELVCEAELALPPEASAASTACADALASGEAAFGPDHPQLIASLISLARQDLRRARADDAVAILERAAAIAAHGTLTQPEAVDVDAYLAIALHRAHRDPGRTRTLATSAARRLRALPARATTLGELEAEFPDLAERAAP